MKRLLKEEVSTTRGCRHWSIVLGPLWQPRVPVHFPFSCLPSSPINEMEITNLRVLSLADLFQDSHRYQGLVWAWGRIGFRLHYYQKK